MERISITIADGSTAVLEQKALKKKMTKGNGKPNLTQYLRHLIAKDTGVKNEKSV